MADSAANDGRPTAANNVSAANPRERSMLTTEPNRWPIGEFEKILRADEWPRMTRGIPQGSTAPGGTDLIETRGKLDQTNLLLHAG